MTVRAIGRQPLDNHHRRGLIRLVRRRHIRLESVVLAKHLQTGIIVTRRRCGIDKNVSDLIRATIMDCRPCGIGPSRQWTSVGAERQQQNQQQDRHDTAGLPGKIAPTHCIQTLISRKNQRIGW